MPLLCERSDDRCGPCAAPGRAPAGADGAQVGRDLVGEHLLQAEAEQVRRVAAVGPRDDVAAESRRAARPAVAAGAAVDQPGADGAFGLDVADAVVRARAEALRQRELALEELPAAPDRAGRIARDDEDATSPASATLPTPAPIS